MRRRAVVGGIVLLALVAGAALRFMRLNVRPMHHDEANQAVKFGALLERGEYRYDPQDHHGPTLYYLSLPSAWLRGQRTLASLDERTLRGVTAAFGAATILLVPALARGIGRTAVAASAWLIALSPAMVFYSRMFIQESLLAFFTLAFVIAIGRVATSGGRSWSAIAGVAAGMAVATKETSIIILPATLVACAISCWSLRRRNATQESCRQVEWRSAAVVASTSALAVAALFYSSFFSEPGGVFAPLRAAGTYFERGSEAAGHAQPWHYYLRIVTYTSSGGLRWSEGVAIVLGIAGAFVAWRAPSAVSPDAAGLERSFWARYLTCHVILVAAMFSAIPYKTPWNLLPFYVVLLVLAGVGFASVLQASHSTAVRSAATAALVIISAQLGWQAWRASIDYASDPRNPYVYAQTVPDAVRMSSRILRLSALHPDGSKMVVAVIAHPYEQWPLPWYLRTMPHVGYWNAPAGALAVNAPVVVSSMDHTAAVDEALGERYVSEFYGLRPEVLMTLHVERELWDRFVSGAAQGTSEKPSSRENSTARLQTGQDD